MINHGISTGALFFLVGMMYERRHSRLIESYGVSRASCRCSPRFSRSSRSPRSRCPGRTASWGIPGAAGSVPYVPVAATIATTGVIVAAAYLLTACSA